MYGDTTVIRRLADRLDERAGDLRAKANALGAAAESARWVSIAGDRMKERVASRRADLDDTAADYEDAAAKLRHHADKVDDLKHLIATIEHKVLGLISGAVDRIKDAASAVVHGLKDLVTGGSDDSADQRLAHYSPPPPGDKAWLDVPDDLGVSV